MNESTLVLVAGYAGVGKSEFAQLLSKETGWPSFDKDVVTKPLVERLLRDLGADVNDRYSEVYQKHVRDREYQSFMEFGIAKLAHGSAILNAPFLRETRDPQWLKDLAVKCAEVDAQLVIIWVHATPKTMRARIQARGAARDDWKLTHWDNYMSTVDLTVPSSAHYAVDNNLDLNGSSTALSLRDQAQKIAATLA